MQTFNSTYDYIKALLNKNFPDLNFSTDSAVSRIRVGSPDEAKNVVRMLRNYRMEHISVVCGR